MAGDKFLTKAADGALQEVEGTQSSSGAPNAGDIVALDSGGKIDTSLLPTGIGADTATVQASENLTAGDWVNVWSSGGSFRVRKADATSSGKYADGFVLASVTSGNPATVYFAGTNNQVSGMTPGPVFLSTTAGVGTGTAPSGSGNVQMRLGTATSSTTVEFHPLTPIILA